MASFLKKIRMKSAQNKMSHFDFSHSHLTTQNFCQIMPITNTELIPNSHVECSPSTFARFDAMPQPTFMDVDIINRAFFVPYELVWRPFHAFIMNLPYNNGNGEQFVPRRVPIVEMNTLVQFFVMSSQLEPSGQDPYMSDSEIINSDRPLGQFVKNNDPDVRYDLFFPHLGSSSDHTFGRGLRLSSKGRHFYKILSSLGYKLDTTQVVVHGMNEQFSLLPLLCYCKVFLDWIYPTQYTSATSNFNFIDSLLKREYYYVLQVDDLVEIFDLFTKYFSDDSYFVNAFDNANFPDGLSTAQDLSLTETTDTNTQPAYSNAANLDRDYSPGAQLNTALSDDFGGSYVVDGNTELAQNNYHPTNWALAAVSKLGSWLKRNQLAGAKVIDRFLARYGVQLPSEKLQRCYYLGEQKFQAIFGDVMSTAETSDASLGDFAGKGVAYNDDKTFIFDNDEFGQFMVLNVVAPRVTYPQGYDRQLKHISTFDFYQPEFDGLGFVPVAKGELLSPATPEDYGLPYSLNISGQDVPITPSMFNSNNVPISTYNNFYREVFGYMPRYVECKLGRDRQTGNFALSKIAGIQSWTPARYFHLFDFTIDSDTANYLDLKENLIPKLRHSPRFMIDDGVQYLRLFYSQENFQDYITIRHYFKMSVNSPMKPLFDTFEFEGDNDKKDITISSQGSKV